MNHKLWAYSALSGALALSAANLKAQETPTEMPPPPMFVLQAGMPEGEPPELGDRIEVLGFGGLHGGKVVKGAPFTATAVSESTQTLADGNRITRTTRSKLLRDSKGRFRREMTLPSMGPLAASGQAHSLIVISDPVAGVGYALEPDTKIARKMPGHTGMKSSHGGPHGPLGDHPWKGNAEANVQKESLGTKNINGINAEGTRFTGTIAAGEIGNDKPITIVSERWYSPELQMVVMSKHSDPRFGDSSYSLTDIQRTEPDASMFTVPADYTVKEGRPERGMRKFHGPPPTDAPPPPGNGTGPPADNELLS